MTEREKLPLYLRVEERQKEKEERLEALRKEKQLKELENCTFRPSIKGAKGHSQYSPPLLDRLYQYETAQEKAAREREQRQEREMLELEKCTFRPKTSTKRASGAGGQVPGYEKAVGRLRYANNLHKMKKYQLEHISTG
jgi:hypothetical protein